MFALRYGGQRTVTAALMHRSTAIHRSFASRIDIPFAPPPFPVVESCPSPTCQCRETPAGLDIEREQNLNGTMAAYASQVLISTGQDDWKSRIEEEEDAVFIQKLKKFLGRGGKYSDPYNNVLLTNTSFDPSPPTTSTSPSDLGTNQSSPSDPSTPPASAYILPTFDYIPSIPTTEASIESFVRGFLLPTQLHHSHANASSREDQNTLLRAPQLRQAFAPRPVHEILVLICGHGGRDERCGVLGPLLRAEFADKLVRQGVRVLPEKHGGDFEQAAAGGSGGGRGGGGEHGEYSRDGAVPPARVGLISHIGGHKFAGNVIVYLPPNFAGNTLNGKGIWYGRVGPEQVEGVVAETIIGGKVIRDLFRGGIDRSGEILRL